MEPLGDIKVLIGVVIVFMLGGARFNTAPPAKPSVPAGASPALDLLTEAFQFRREPALSLFPPPRAQTTFFKFELYRVAYALTGVLAYLVLYAIPGVAPQVDRFLGLFSSEKMPILTDAGPVFLALVVAIVFPVMPPFRAGEWAVRRVFYDRACIPAQQLREMCRLKGAQYIANPDMLKTVRDTLSQEGFLPGDLLVEEAPTTRSLWTKAATLMAHIEQWQSDDRYKSAFATLCEVDRAKRSVDCLGEAYEALKPDARMYFKAVREQPDAAETAKREEAFRRNCRDLLVSIYGLLSRVSLHAHYTDHERATSMRELGFVLVPSQSGPIPDANDVVTLGVLIGAVVFFPLSYRVTTPRAILISVEVYVAIIVPILLAARLPLLARAQPNGTPGLAFPVLAGLIAAAVGVVAHVLVLSIGRDPHFDLVLGWSRYATRSYPWSFLLFLIAALIAWRMQTGSYPDPESLRGLARVKQWGSPTDAGQFFIANLAFVALYIRPKVAELWHKPEFASDWMLLITPVAIATVVGFVVPTWYRAHLTAIKSRTIERRLGGGEVPAPAASARPTCGRRALIHRAL
jgi:hypothetical protein